MYYLKAWRILGHTAECRSNNMCIMLKY